MDQDETGSRGTWLKIIGFLVALGIGFFVARGIGQLAGHIGASDGGMLATNLQAAAKQIRAQAPIKVDSVTTLNGAAAMGDTIIYTMTLDLDIPTRGIAAAQARQQATDAQRACADADIRKLIAAGGKMRWIYTDRSGDQFQANLTKCP